MNLPMRASTNPLSIEINCIREYAQGLLKHLRRKLGCPPQAPTFQQKRRLREPHYHKPVINMQTGNDLVAARLASRLPLMVTRLGGGEHFCVTYYLKHGGFTHGRTYVPYFKQELKTGLRDLSGFFPLEDPLLDRFCEQTLAQITDADVMGVWFNDYENVVCQQYCPNAELVEPGFLEPFRFQHPWSYQLKGKRVLVVHPFVESIARQYTESRQYLWDNPEVLPEFELKTVKAVQSLGGTNVDFATWFDAYQFMCDQIAKVDFDIAIIGAGSYGLPLASFIKRLGKQAIHMGGVTQILFGIKGKRWETEYANVPIFRGNEHWIRPSESETPTTHTQVENGCYW